MGMTVTPIFHETVEIKVRIATFALRPVMAGCGNTEQYNQTPSWIETMRLLIRADAIPDKIVYSASWNEINFQPRRKIRIFQRNSVVKRPNDRRMAGLEQQRDFANKPLKVLRPSICTLRYLHNSKGIGTFQAIEATRRATTFTNRTNEVISILGKRSVLWLDRHLTSVKKSGIN
jgi:hypothetical protein